MERISSPEFPEFLQELFSYLNVADLMNIRLVCKTWREVTFLPSFNDKVVVSLTDSDVQSITKLVDSGFSISNLKFVKVTTGSIFSTLEFWSFYGKSLKSLCLKDFVFGVECSVNLQLHCCPNLESLQLRNCSGLTDGTEYVEARKGLKELLLAECDINSECIVNLVSLLSPALANFEYYPNESQNNLSTLQLTSLFQLLKQTLREIVITWLGSTDLDFDAIFGVPGLKLKEVVLQCDFCFDEVIDALAKYQKDSLESIFVIDKYSDVDDSLKKCLSSDFPNLQTFIHPVDLDDIEMVAALSTLHDVVPNNTLPSLCCIIVGKLIDFGRTVETEPFVLNKLFANFTGNSFVEEYNDVVAKFLVGQSLGKMTELTLRNVDLSQHGIANSIFTNCINLVELSLKRCNLSDALLMDGVDSTVQTLNADTITPVWDEVVFPIMKLTKLNVLVLSDNIHLTNFSVSRVIKFPKITTLELGGNSSFCGTHFTQIGLGRFSQIALNNPCLEIVTFAGMNLTDDFIIGFVRNALNLIDLNLVNISSLTNEAVCELTKHEKLSKLTVHGSPEVTEAGIGFASFMNKELKVTLIEGSLSLDD